MINTGASGAIPRSDTVRRDAHAELYYEEVRKRRDDADKIAKNTGFPADDIQTIKNHVFFNVYDLGDENPERFDPDYDMAVSWQRLTEGKAIQEMDIIMLNHELMEYKLMNEQGIKYGQAHDITNEIYNYSKYLDELDRKEDLH